MKYVVCSVGAIDLPKGWSRDYATFRAAALKAGRFSVFEATETEARARMFGRLSRDPGILLTRLGFPWTKVELRS